MSRWYFSLSIYMSFTLFKTLHIYIQTWMHANPVSQMLLLNQFFVLSSSDTHQYPIWCVHVCCSFPQHFFFLLTANIDKILIVLILYFQRQFILPFCKIIGKFPLRFLLNIPGNSASLSNMYCALEVFILIL